MPNEVLSKYGVSTALTMTLASLADASSRQATQITDASPSAPIIEIFYKITTGATPVVDKQIEFYISRADDDASEHADGATGTTDAAYSGNLDQLELVHTQVVSATANQGYLGSFRVPHPGTDWRLVIKNNTGFALNATAGNHYVRYRTIIPEVQ